MSNCILRRSVAVVFAGILGLGVRELFAEPPRVLLLGDAGSEGQVRGALRSAGHDVVYGGLYYEWNGVDPDVDDFDVVVYLDAIDYGYGLLPAADAAVSAFVAAGGGLVITEWSTYDDHHDYLSPGISALMPVTAPVGGCDYESTWHVLDPTHQLAGWLPPAWRDAAGYSIVVPHANATVVIESAGGNPMLTYRTDVGGRVVHSTTI